LSEVSSEITFQVSNEAAKSFKKFFSIFDEELSSLGIVSYGVSITTLEEVFLKINKEFQINIGNAALDDKHKEQTGEESLSERVEAIRRKAAEGAVNSSLDFDNIETRIQSNTLVSSYRGDDDYESPDDEAVK